MEVSAQQYDAQGAVTGSVVLPEAIFGQVPHRAALHAYTKMYLANQRQGTAKTKTRAEVAGGGAKPWRQKGTGRARAGSRSSPVWVGGGRAFGPRVRSHRQRLPRQVRRLALVSALSLKAQQGVVCVWAREEMENPKTGAVVETLAKMGLVGRETVFLDEGSFPNLLKSCRNIPWFTHRRADLANAYQILRAHALVVTPEGLKRLTEVLAS